jgi:hypothetical protein
MAAQDVLERLAEEILSSTHLPFAVQFLAAELKHSGLLSSGFALLPHYFTAFQTFVIGRTEVETLRFSIETALLVLEREAQYRAGQPTRPGLFVYQFEVLCRNRLGYDGGLAGMAQDPFYDSAWRDFLNLVRRQAGTIDFSDLVYLRSEWYVIEQRRRRPSYKPPVPPLFGEKEGKIAKASRGRDPLFLFAALQRQLGYPEVPRSRPRDDLPAQLESLKMKINLLGQRLRLLESEVRGQVDFSQFGKPELLQEKDEGFLKKEG